MNKYIYPTILKKKRVELGDGHIDSYIIFEYKYLFSIIIYNWKTIKQNRFHSHAFPAYALLLRGKYEQEVIVNNEITKNVVDQLFKFRWLPRNYIHRILKADPNTWTIVFTGPWIKNWFEYFEDTKTWVKYSWGRKVVSKTLGFPEELRKE